MFVIETGVLCAAVLVSAYLFHIGSGSGGAGLFVWLLRAMVFSGIMIMCMAVLKLYQGRPGERVSTALLRLAGSFAIGGGVLQFIYFVLPVLRIEPFVLITSMVLAFFLLGTMRPVFLDSITERRKRLGGHLRPKKRSLRTGGDDDDDAEMSREEFLARLARNEQSTSLTAQHRITRRGL